MISCSQLQLALQFVNTMKKKTRNSASFLTRIASRPRKKIRTNLSIKDDLIDFLA